MSSVSYILTSSPSCFSSVRKGIVNPVTLINDRERARIENTLLKVKPQTVAMQRPASFKRNFPYVHFAGSTLKGCSFGLL